MRDIAGELADMHGQHHGKGRLDGQCDCFCERAERMHGASHCSR